MLYRIGTVKEIGILRGSFTRDIFEQLNENPKTEVKTVKTPVLTKLQ